MASAGLSLEDVSEVVLTHAHGDHIDGLVHVRARVLCNEVELAYLGAALPRVMRRVLRQPLPEGFGPRVSRSTVGPSGPSGAAARSATTAASSPSTRPGTPPATYR